MTQDEHLDELASLFIEECQAHETFGVAIRVLDESNIRLVCLKVPAASLAKLLRDAADLCERSGQISQIVQNSQIN